MNRGLGYRPDPPKRPHERGDLSASLKLRAAPLPMIAKNQRLVLSVLDQGARSTCVRHVVSQAIRMSHVLQGAIDPPLSSRLFGYYLDRARMNEVHQDNGTYLRIAFENQNKFGFCPEALWPYTDDPTTYQKMPAAECFHAAYDQRAPNAYFRIFDTGLSRVVAVQRAIAAGYAVVFGTAVSQRFCNNDLGTTSLRPPEPHEIVGNHALLLAGYDVDTSTGQLYFDCLNSWGTGFGIGGYCRMSPEYVISALTADLWIVQAAPLFSGARP